MSESKPREFWMSKDGDGYYDKNSDYPTRHPDKVIHVIEFSTMSAVEKINVLLNSELGKAKDELHAERERNLNLAKAAMAVLSDVDCAPVTGGLNLSTIENLRKAVAENGESK